MKINKNTLCVLDDAKKGVLKDLRKVGGHLLEFLVFSLKVKAFSVYFIILGIVWLLPPCDQIDHIHSPVSIPRAILCFIIAYVFHKLLDIIDYFKNK